MYILENVPLSGYSTMRLGGTAAYLTEVTSRSEITEALTFAAGRGIPVIMIGGGSNIVWNDSGFPGLVMVNKIMRFETFAEDDDNLYVTAGAGEVWDNVVERTVNMGFSGIEYLSLIPGSTGGTPVQNVGAYGHEISEVLVSLEAYDTHEQKFINIPTADCGFAYRTSRFKTTDKGRFFISAITMHVMRTAPTPPFYGALQSYFDEHGIKTYTPAVVREAVIAIRSSKLPDPALVANSGSFFANPIVPLDTFTRLQMDFQDLAHWKLENGQVKLSAAWLVEQAGFKDFHDPETGIAIWPKQALVLINEHAKNTADLLKFKQKVTDAVVAKFDIVLEQEPELLP